MLREKRSTLADIVFDAAGQGRRAFATMRNGVQTLFLSISIELTVQVTTIATAIRNGGRASAALSELGIAEAGADTFNVDPRAARYRAETLSPSSLSFSALSNLAVGTYTIRDTFRLYFAEPYAIDPAETAYVERDPAQALQFFATLASNAFARLYEGGAGTVTGRVRVSQVFDDTRATRPLFLPRARMVTMAVPGTNTRAEQYLRTSSWLRGLTIMQDDTIVGSVTDIIAGLGLRGDFREIIGPDLHDFAHIVRDSEMEYGGAVSSDLSRLHLNFQRQGRLSSVLSPAQDNNLRAILSVAKSAAAGGGSSQVLFALWELERRPGLTDRNGAPLVRDSVGFDV